MNRLTIIGALLFAASALSACASKQPTPPPLEIVPQEAPEAEATPTPPTAEDLIAQQPPEVQAAIKQHEQDGSWQVFRTDQAQLYPYGALLLPSPLAQKPIDGVNDGDIHLYHRRTIAPKDPQRTARRPSADQHDRCAIANDVRDCQAPQASPRRPGAVRSESSRTEGRG
jgi:hypothetical protein